jgi:hypothetical protein
MTDPRALKTHGRAWEVLVASTVVAPARIAATGGVAAGIEAAMAWWSDGRPRPGRGGRSPVRRMALLVGFYLALGLAFPAGMGLSDVNGPA